MFQSIVISPDQELGGRLAAALKATEHVAISKTFPSYPPEVDLTRTLRAHATETVFLSFESLDDALEISRILENEAAHVQVVGFHKSMDMVILHESMRAGVREFLTDPFERQAVMQSLVHVKILLEKHPAEYAATDQIFSFLPSKAGVGTSTIAANVAAALARAPGARVLLSDFDLNSSGRFPTTIRQYIEPLQMGLCCPPHPSWARASRTLPACSWNRKCPPSQRRSAGSFSNTSHSRRCRRRAAATDHPAQCIGQNP